MKWKVVLGTTVLILLTTGPAASAGSRHAPAPTAPTSTSSPETTTESQKVDLSRGETIALAAIYVVAILLAAGLSGSIDIVKAYGLKKRQLASIDQLANEVAKLDHKELVDLLAGVGQAPTGIRALSRSTMTLTVLVVLGIGVVHTLVVLRDTEVAKTILSILGGLVAAAAGFYFGGRTAQEAAGQDAKPTVNPIEGKS